MKKNLLLAAIAGIMLSSCHTGREAALQDLRNLTTEIEANAPSYNFKEWVKEQKKYEKIDRRLSKYDYSQAESHEIGELKGQCLGYIAKGVLGKASNKIIYAANQIQGIIDGVQKVLTP